jgi:hypothetical protein
MTEELKDKLNETLAICEVHHQRMMFALENVNHYFPLTETLLGEISPIDLALFDQLIYRFSKLQDSMGARLFRQLLEYLEEDVSGVPFIDLLNRLEKLGLLQSANEWHHLRQTRNIVSHEYPFFKDVQIEELNLLPGEVKVLSQIWNGLKEYVQKRIMA